jgi:hypothetical protein
MKSRPMVIATATTIFTCFFIGFYCDGGYKKISETWVNKGPPRFSLLGCLRI